MNPFLSIFLVLVHVSLFTLAQNNDKPEVKALNRQIIARKDTLYRFYAINPDHPVSTRPDRNYYWYRSDTILTTAGGYDGRLLDGSFTVFYPDKNLKEEGLFKNGLRSGEWKNWYPGGRIRNILHWKDGGRNGPFTEYDSTGKKIREGSYKNDYLFGVLKEYTPDGKCRKVKYKHGTPVAPKPASEPASKTEPKPQPAAKEKKKSDNGHAS